MNAAGWIPRERIAAAPLAHSWDDWNPYRFLRGSDLAVERRCRQVSARARVGFSIACAEWVLARFERHHFDLRPWHYLESCWAALVDPAFASFADDVLDDDVGPVRGPISLALATVTDAFRTEDAGDPAFAAALARHVLPAGCGFVEWQEACLSRLERRHPWSVDRAVAREGFGVELEEDEESRLVRRFLRQLSARENPFLVPSRH